MNVLYQELVERFRGEVVDLERIVLRALHAWPQARRASDVQGVYLDSVALNLHSFYSGVERLFELVGRHVDFPPLETHGIAIFCGRWRAICRM